MMATLRRTENDKFRNDIVVFDEEQIRDKMNWQGKRFLQFHQLK